MYQTVKCPECDRSTEGYRHRWTELTINCPCGHKELRKVEDPVPDRYKPMYYIYTPPEKDTYGVARVRDLMSMQMYSNYISRTDLVILRSLLEGAKISYDDALDAVGMAGLKLFKGKYDVNLHSTVVRRSGAMLFDEQFECRGVCVSVFPFVVYSENGEKQEMTIRCQDHHDKESVFRDVRMEEFFVPAHDHVISTHKAIEAYERNNNA